MSEPDFMTQILPLWLPAAVAFSLLVMVKGVSEVLCARGYGGAVRMYRGALYILIPLLLLLPSLLIDTGGSIINAGLLFYILFFSGFCYYLGRNLGWKAGRRNLSELIGMETPESLEDTQDRLFESRMRFPHRGDVVKSIGELAKAEAEARENQASTTEQADFKLKL